jgi:membrane-associated protein
VSVVSWVVDEILELHGPAAYALVGGLAFGESALFVGLGGLIWAVGFTLLGYAAGASYEKVESAVGTASDVVLVVLALAVFVFLVRRRRRSRDSTHDRAA